ncbi:MAG: hypothetical protein ABJH07_10310 [Sedimentitalea sp.]|uniref:hypothetical protein n=1 Tax=Sedimentitalea sp. TaxID=2048915 RepID=UPI0032650AC2
MIPQIDGAILSHKWKEAMWEALSGGIHTITDGSDQTIQALITANYQVNDNLFLSAGYRRLDLDYEDGGTKIDWTMVGPMLELTWRI